MADSYNQEVERRRNAEDIAVLKVEVRELRAAMAEVKLQNREQTEKIDLLLESIAEARGGLRTLMKFGGAGLALGAAMSWVVEHLLKLIK